VGVLRAHWERVPWLRDYQQRVLRDLAAEGVREIFPAK